MGAGCSKKKPANQPSTSQLHGLQPLTNELYTPTIQQNTRQPSDGQTFASQLPATQINASQPTTGEAPTSHPSAGQLYHNQPYAGQQSSSQFSASQPTNDQTLSSHPSAGQLYDNQPYAGQQPPAQQQTPANEPRYTALQIRKHNEAAGWNEWSVFKRKVYDTKKIRQVFTPLILEERQAIKDTPISEDSMSDEDSLDSLDYRYGMYVQNDLNSDATWNQNGVYLVTRNGIEPETLDARLPECCIGVVEDQPASQLLEEFRLDAKSVLDDLFLRDANNELTDAERDYLHQLQRWFNDNKSLEDQLGSGKVGNDKAFPLSANSRSDPESLRAWIVSWQPLDTEVPEAGAWEVIPEGIVAEDVCTELQLRVQAARSNVKVTAPKDWSSRTPDELLPMREAQRNLLVGHFINWYDEDKKEQSELYLKFKDWFDLMLQAWEDLQALCKEE